MLQGLKTGIRSCSSHSELQVCICPLWEDKHQTLLDWWSTAAHSPPKKSHSILPLPGQTPSVPQLSPAAPQALVPCHTQMTTQAQVPPKSQVWHHFLAGKRIFHPKEVHSSLPLKGSLPAPPLEPPGAPQDKPHIVPSDPAKGHHHWLGRVENHQDSPPEIKKGKPAGKLQPLTFYPLLSNKTPGRELLLGISSWNGMKKALY